MDGPLGARAAVRRPSRPAQAPEASALSRIPLSVITLIVAIGVFVSCMGYARGRAGNGPNSTSGLVLYWAGQVMILVPIAGRLLSRRPLSNGGIVTLITLLTVAEYVLKCAYMPLGFAFNDTFLHWSGTHNMLQSGMLFELNYGLPVGTHYPGLEEVTSALISATGLSIYQAGLVVAGIAHLLYVLFLYLAFCAAIRSHRIAGIAIMIYFSAQDFTSFNAMFVYETLALAFLAMCIVAGLRSSVDKSPADRRRWFIVAVLCIFATVITHHVTSYMLTGFLFLVAIASRLTGSRNTAKRFGILAVVSLLTVVCWIAFAARDTISYFAPTALGVLQGIQALTSSGSSNAPSVGGSPLDNTVLEAAGLLITFALIAAGSWQAWKRHRRHPWIIGMMIGSLGWFGTLAVRLGTANGQELAGRSATYVYIPVCILGALALTRLVNGKLARRWGAGLSATVVALVVVMVIDGLANGWPPFWERLPGPHQVAAFESSVGPREITIGKQSLTELGPGNRIAADSGIYPLFFSYGGQNPLQIVSYLYKTPTWSAALAGQANAQDVQYLETDTRLTQSIPPGGGDYFPGQSSSVTKTIPLANLNKFNHIQGVSRVYDDGTISIYDLVTQGYVPSPQP
jgi:hypothetical protein